MTILLVTPAPAGSTSGNRITALRWASLLRSLGHRVAVSQAYSGRPCDLLVALHARRSFSAVRAFRRRHPGRPILLALTGTDLYRDLRSRPSAGAALEWAAFLIVLQPAALRAIPARFRTKARVILQSATPPPAPEKAPGDEFRVGVLSHLRPVKDPFRAARAARLLPAASRVRVVHLGRAMSARMKAAARREMDRSPRYRWLGEIPPRRARSVLAGCRLLVLSSRLEGGANVLSEAMAAGVPVLASRIPGTVGILGAGYPGYFSAGDTRGLAELIERTEASPGFQRRLRRWCRRLAPLVRPAREREAWRRLLGEAVVQFPPKPE